MPASRREAVGAAIPVPASRREAGGGGGIAGEADEAKGSVPTTLVLLNGSAAVVPNGSNGSAAPVGAKGSAAAAGRKGDALAPKLLAVCGGASMG